MPTSHSEEWKIAARFIAYYQKDWAKPFGGNDYAAFEGFCSGVRLYGRADIRNRPAAILMLRGAVLAMQEHNRHCAYLAIIAILDWEIAGALIPRLVPNGDTFSVPAFLKALGRHGDQNRPRLGRVDPDPERVPLIQIKLWPEAKTLDLSKATDRTALARLDPEDLVQAGWSFDAAFRWYYALCLLADVVSEEFLQDFGGGGIAEQQDSSTLPRPSWLPSEEELNAARATN